MPDLSFSEKKKLNRMLGNAGLSQLDDPRGLCAQIALTVTSHRDFRRILAKCSGKDRVDCYNSLRGFIRFKVKPLDDYLIEIKQEAEREKLPTLNPDGSFSAFEPAHNAREPLEATAEEVIRNGMAFDKAKRYLVLTCSKCTIEMNYFGETMVDAVQKARKAGWVYDSVKECEICPKCPAVRPN